MGCTQSKIDNEEAVSRCKDRRNFMREAVVARNAFASGHSGYAVALKNTGAALSEYAQGEVPPPPDLTAEPGPVGVNEPPPPPPPSISEANLPPPPPPLPNFSPLPPPMPSFSPSPATPLQRAVTMPAQQVRKMKGIDGVDEEGEDEEEGESNIGGLRQRDRRRKVVEDTASESETPIKTPMPPPPPDTKGMAWDYFYDNTLDSSLPEMEEEEEEEEDEDYMEEKNENQNVNFNKMGLNNDDINNFRTPEKLVRGIQIDEITPEIVKEKPLMHSNTAPPGYRFPGNTSSNVNSVDLLKVLSDIDDHFLKASESAQEVSKMLEATRLHYHSNFADNRGHIDHAARVMRVITWNRSFRGVPNGDNGKEEYDTEEYETHATVLDKLLAWEKKLYEEVKAGELMKLEYQRKVSVLNKLKKREASTEALERAKAAVSHLHTRYIVDMQSLDSTVSEVNDIRDKQLYPKLVALVNGMGRMWESMCIHHDDQLKIVNDLRSLDVSGSPKYTTEYHHNRTLQLLRVVDEWNLQFEKLTKNQKQYINALNSWLKLNLIPIESNLKEKISSPPRVENPPIQALLRSWNESLEKLPDELAKSATASFAAVIKAIIDHQLEEMKLKEKCDETRKEYLRKSQGFDDWYHKYMQKRGPEETDDTTSVGLNPIGEKKLVVDLLKKKLDEEEEDYYKHCVQVREKSIGSLKIRLPELFRAMSDYSHACFDAYQRLRAYTQVQMPNGGS